MFSNLICLIANLLWLASVMVDAIPQLDLPPIRNNGGISDGRSALSPGYPKVLLNSYTDGANAHHQQNDDERVQGVAATDYDRDRSERFGPPYNIENIERAAAPPTSNHEGYRYGNPQENSRYPNNNNDGSPPIYNGIRGGSVNGGNPNLNFNRDRSIYDRNQDNDRSRDADRNRDFNDFRNGYDGNRSPPLYDDSVYRIEEEERQNRAETERVRKFLAEIDAQNSVECSLNVQAQWNFETNVNEITQLHAVKCFFNKF